MPRRATAYAVCLFLVAGLGAVTAPAEAVDPLPATFSADPLPTWQTNGTVWALETIGNVVYVGGSFTKVRPPGTAEGSSSEVDRLNFAAFNATTGELLPCNPTITNAAGNAKVYALEASPSGDRLYVGGSFGRVGTTGVASLVALNPSTCALLPTASFRRPNMASAVKAISATSTHVYVGGEFIAVDSQPRTRFAGLTSNGTLLPGSVTLDGKVHAVLAATDVGKVYLGGEFVNVNGTPSRALVALNPTTLGVVKTFSGMFGENVALKAFTRDSNTLYMGAEGSGYGLFDGRMAINIDSGAIRWVDNCLGANQALVVDNGVLYSGHHAHECMTTPGGWLEDGFRNHLSAQDVRDSTLIQTFIPDTDDGIGVAPLGPRALVVAGNALWVGGEFTKVNDGAQRGLTRFGRQDTGLVSPPVLSVTPVRVGVNVISWTAGFDRDEDELTYELFRDNVLINTQTVRSREWARPQLQYVDRSVSAGQVVRYQIRVVEPDGQNVGNRSSAVTVTSASSNSGYPAAVMKDEPSLYWRLDETAEQEARTRNGLLYYRARMNDSSGHARRGTAERGDATVSPDGYALGGPSALGSGTGASVQFTGTTGRVVEGFVNDFKQPRNAPQEYSVEVWFRTSGTTGGRLAGFGNRQTQLYERTPPATPPSMTIAPPPVYVNSLSTVTDRLLYLTDSGQLVFGVLNGSTRVTLKSVNAYNDREWHHAVATQGPGGMRLFVDGVQVGSNGTSGNNTYAGYWKLGYDQLTSWADRPASNAFRGYLDEFAVYPEALTPAQIAAHYTAARPGAVIDLTPPSAVTGLSLSRSGQAVTATWAAATDNVGVTGYSVYRTATAGAALTGSALVGTTSSTTRTFTETGVPAGTWYYRVVANDAAGNQGPPSSAASIVIPTPPVTLTATPVADTYVHAGLKTTIFGSSSTMISDGDPVCIALIRFDVPAAPSGKVLTGATLRLKTTTDPAASSVDTHSIVTASNSWVESTTNWNNRPSVGTTVLGTVPANTVVNQVYEISLSVSAVQALLGTQSTLGMVASGPDTVLFWTREASAANRPQLILNFDNP